MADKRKAPAKKRAPVKKAKKVAPLATTKPTLQSRLPRIGRDSILFFSGLIGVFHETVIADAEKPTLLLLFATMIGLPAFLRSDEKKE